MQPFDFCFALKRLITLLLITVCCLVQAQRFASDHILTFTGKPDAESERARLQLDMKLTDFEYTGLYLPANTSLTLEVVALQGEVTPSLLIGTFDLDDSEPRVLELSPGYNTVTDALGGVLYLRFPNPESQASFAFSKAALRVPTYTLGSSIQADWQEQLANLNPEVPSATLVSERAMIVVSRQAALAYKDKDQELLLKTFDDILGTQDTLSGLQTQERSPYRYLLVEHHDPEIYMFATDYRTAYFEEAIGYVLDPELLIQDGWGPWHELGHTHQQRAWTWEAMIEVTVNLYSLAVQRSYNLPSRMQENWAEVENYLALPDDQRQFDSDETDLFVRLGMLEQLRLAFGDAFYQELHRQTRELQPDLNSNAEKIAYFAYMTSKLSGYDLRAFYQSWGLELPPQALEAIAALQLPPPEADLSTLGF